MDLFNRKKKRRRALLQKWGNQKAYHENLYYERQLFEYAPGSASIDEKTAEDLDFDRFFTFVDRTTSVIGQQHLYRRLRQNQIASEKQEELEEAIAFYDGKDPFPYLDNLSKFKRDKDYVFPLMLHGDIPMMPRFRGLIRFMQLLSFACILFGISYPVLWIALVPIMVVNLVLHYRIKQEMGLFVDVFSRLRDLYKISLNLMPISHHSELIKEELQQHLQQLKKVTKRLNFLIFDEKLNEREGANVMGYFAEVVKYVTLMDVVTYYAMLEQLPEIRAAAASIFNTVGEIDLALSVLALRGTLSYFSKPVLTKPGGMKVKDMYHPLISTPVSNNLDLKEQGMLITGSNMSGKSTFIKTINLNVLAAQNLNTAFASSYVSRPWQLATSMNTSDDLAEGASYYLQEVERIGTLLALSREEEVPFLITIDEVFRGTNTIERVSSAKAVLEYLAQSGSMVLVSTHDLELADLLEGNYALYHFQEAIKDEALSFDYQLKSGVMTERNAIKILGLMGYPKAVVEEAERLAKGF